MKLRAILCMMLSVILLTLCAVPAMAVFPDTTGTKYETAAQVLMDLGIMYGNENGKFAPDDDITRAEFTVVIIRAMGLSDLTVPTENEAKESVFSDVPLDYWCVEDINLAYEMGLVCGKENNLFKPEDSVTSAEAIKMIVTALGYGDVACYSGGYPNGYMEYAVKLGLLKNVDAAPNEPISRGDVALMIYEALSARMLSLSSIKGTDVPSITYDDNKTLAEGALGLYYEEGRITANHITSLTGEYEVAKGYVMIDGVLYNAGDTKAAEMLGNRVKFYYKEDSGERALFSVVLHQNQDVLELNYKEHSYEFSNGVYTYYADGKRRTEKISDVADIIYNGKAEFNCTPLEMAPKTGSIKLIDSKNSGTYDIVIIEDYVNFPFASFEAPGTFYGLGRAKAELKDRAEWTLVDTNGVTIPVSELLYGEVLSAIVSKDGEYGQIIKNEEVVDGCITQMYTDGDKQYIAIDDSEYLLADDFYSKSTDKIELGAEGSFYLDIFGNVAYFTGNSDTFEWGYLVDCAGKGNLGNKVEFKIFTSDGEMSIFSNAKKIYVDDVLADTPQEVVSKISVSGEGSVKQVIRYELNGSGEIRAIDTVADGGVMQKSATAQEWQYRGKTRSFSAQVVLSDNAFVFVIPTDKEDEELYCVQKTSSLLSGRTYTVDTYGTTEAVLADVVVINETEAVHADDRTNVFGIITQTRYAKNEDDEYVLQLTLINANGNEEKAFVNNLDVVSTMDPFAIGDAVFLTLNTKGNVAAVKKFYSAESGKGMDTGKLASQFRVGNAFVYRLNDNLMEIALSNQSSYGVITEPDFENDEESKTMEVYPADKFNVFIYDKAETNGEAVYKGSYQDIYDYVNTGKASRIIFQTRYGDPVAMLIIK